MMRDLAKKLMLVVLITGCSLSAVIPVYANDEPSDGGIVLCDFPEKKEI